MRDSVESARGTVKLKAVVRHSGFFSLRLLALCLYSAAMKAMDVNLRSEVVRWQEKLFKRSIRRQMRLRELKELIGITTNQNFLEITAGDGVISSRLRDGGGRWKTLVPSETVKVSVDWFVDDQVEVLNGPCIKEPDGTYDVVVIVDVLERVRDDYAFIKECHRVLKPDGRLVVTATRKMGFCVGSCPIRSMLGLSWRAKGFERPAIPMASCLKCSRMALMYPKLILIPAVVSNFPGCFAKRLPINWLAEPTICREQIPEPNNFITTPS